MSSDALLHDLVVMLGEGKTLGEPEIRSAVEALLSETVRADLKASFLRAFRAKGETAAEIAALVDALLERAVEPGLDPASLPGPMLDVCGTGGDRLNLFNVSTTGMFILAAGGVAVVKHGNRSITSQCGGADVLETLGVPIDLSPEELREQVRRAGLGFIFAPRYHPAFRVIGPVRKQLAEQGETSVFNLLGPLLNPARPAHQLVGLFTEEVLEKYAEVLARLGRRHAWVVHGKSEDGSGVDELSTMGPTRIVTIRSGKADPAERTFRPSELPALAPAVLDDLKGGSREENARILEAILSGEEHGPRSQLALLNAAAGFTVAGIVKGLEEGYAFAQEQVASGRALEKLRLLQRR